MNINQILNYGICELQKNGIKEPIQKAKRILCFTIKQNKTYLLINDTKELTETEICKYKKCIQELIQGKPLQHITNIQEFMGINFYVDENVLIPRPDTEILVEEVIKITREFENPKILDLCTGSGAIAISISNSVKKVEVTATDISKKALEVANKNDITKKVCFMESDLFENIKGNFDIIVSNPPYIKTRVISELEIEVQKEPKIALDGGMDGLDFYREIIQNTYKYLRGKGYLCLEIGYDQKEEVIELLKKEKYTNIYSRKDLGGNDRVVCAQLK